MKGYSLLLLFLFISSTSNSQVLILTFSALTSTPEGQLARTLEGEWIITFAEIDGENVINQFEGVKLIFPKYIAQGVVTKSLCDQLLDFKCVGKQANNPLKLSGRVVLT